IVRDRKTGLLIDTGHPNELPSVLIELLSNPRLAHNLGESGRALVTKKFTYERFREGVVTLLREVGSGMTSDHKKNSKTDIAEQR
ncbi:MAG: glycosyltransferase, partial [Actinomycetota bacterium]